MLPNFIGIGVQRAATTWLHECLAEHPEVFVPEQKELCFFSREFVRGVTWYEEFFFAADGAKAIGEITPTYLHEAPLERLARIIPDAKLLLILRDPVERAYSAFQLMNGHFSGSFQSACESSTYLTARSLYAGKLEELFTFFDRKQVLVLLYDDIVTNGAGVLREVYQFLDVDDTFTPTTVGETVNHILFPRLQSALAQCGLSWSVDVVKRTPLGTWLKRQGRRTNKKAVATDKPQYFEQLRKSFAPDVQRVEQLIGRNLSQWYEPSRCVE